jgi:hypothetical protein
MAPKSRIARSIFLLKFAPLFLILLGAQGWAQILTTGTISGTVTDMSGAAVPQAGISVFNEETHVATHTVSNASGAFALPGLQPSRYDVSISKQGFKTYSQTGVVLSPAQVFTINARLTVGSVKTTVTVQATAAQVQTSTPEIASLVPGSQVATLPLNGRSYQGLSFLMPGVSNQSPDTGLTNGGFLTSNTISVNGMGISGTMYYVDGIWDENTGNMTQTTITPNPDTIEQVRVLQNNYGVQYNLNDATAMLLQTKSGTSTFHGLAFEYLRNNALDARNFFEPTVSPLKQNIFGYTLGGPVVIPGHLNSKRNKVFFFLSEQWTRQNIGEIELGADATAAMRAGAFPTTGPFASTIINPATEMPFPDNTIPTNMINANSLALLNAQYPLPNNPAGGFYNFINTSPTVNNTRDDEGKLDFNLSTKLRLMAEYLDDHQLNDNATDTFLASPFNTTGEPITTINQLAQIRLTQIISPSMVNTTSVSMNNYDVNLGLSGLVYRSQVPGFSSKLPYSGVYSNRLPQITFAEDYAPLGVDYDLPIPHASDLEDTLSDDWSWLRGNHYLQAGVQYVRGTKRQNDFAATAGDWYFSGLFTSNPIADYLLGDAESFTQQSNEFRPYEHYPIISPYIQDQWKVKRHLTVTAGLRYAFSPLPNFQKGFSTFLPSLYNPADAPIVQPSGVIVSTPTYNPLNGIAFEGITPGVPLNFSSEHQNFLDPSAGFAWDVLGDGKTSLRGGFGMTHMSFFSASCQYECANSYPLTTPLTLVTPPFPNPVGAQVAPATVPSMEVDAENMTEPEIMNFSLSLQHEFSGGWLVSVAGAGDELRHAIFEADANQPLPEDRYNFNPIINTETVSEYAYGEPYPGYGTLDTFSSPANADWYALEVNVQHPVGHHLFLSAAYTWQKGIGETLGSTPVNGAAAPQNIYNLHNEYGPSSVTPSQVFTASAVWSIPWLANSSVAGSSIGCWETGSTQTSPRFKPVFH